jgi:hypothetical protein
MDYGFVEIAGSVAGAALCLLAVFVLSPDAVSRATEAALDRIEVRLALRRQRRRPRGGRAAEASARLSLFESWQGRPS